MSTLTASVLAAVRGRKKGSRLEDDRMPPEDLEDDEETVAEDDEEETSAESEDEEAEAEGEEEEASAEEDEEGERMSADTRVRRAEQSRIRAILTHPGATGNPGLAAELAFGKRLYSAKEAGALLSSSAPTGGRLAGRMQGNSPKIGSGQASSVSAKDQPGRILAAASQIIAAKRQRRS